MTLRVLLQKLHRVAASQGADVEVTFSGAKCHRSYIYDIAPAKRGKEVVISLKKDSEIRPDAKAKKQMDKERNGVLFAAGVCYSCRGEIGESPTMQCQSCREKNNLRNREWRNKERKAKL